MRDITATDRAAIKTATRLLVKRVGGLDAAASACRYAKSAIAATYDPHRMDRSMPIDVVADLEAVAEAPLITEVLARLSGHALVPIGAGGGMEAQAIARVGQRAAEVFAAWAAAHADARVTDAERQRVAQELLELQRACMQAVAALLPQRDEGEK